MEHDWVEYKNQFDATGERSYYCSVCNSKSYIDLLSVRRNDNDYADYIDEPILNCDENIIKNIIE